MRIRTLIIEDEEEIALILRIILNNENMDVDIANTIQDAKSYLKSSKYQIVLLDLNLPGGSGFDLIEDFGLCERSNVIILSAFDGWTERNRAFELGVKHFISKPFKKKELMEVIHNLKQN